MTVPTTDSTPTAPAQEVDQSHNDNNVSGHQTTASTVENQQTKETPSASTEQTEPARLTEASTTKNDDLDLPKSAADGLIQKPFASPLETAHPPPPRELTSEEHSKYGKVLSEVSSWTTVPTTSAKDSPTEPITDDERMFLTRECLLRYLRATKWDVSEAVARLQRTLTWRREYELEKLTPEYISVENETGKQVLLGFDVQARPCLYLIPSNQNTEKSDRQIQHLVFMLERLIELMGPDQDSLALIVNFNDTKSGQSATIGQAKQTLNILQNHYPERLGRALVINLPLIIRGFFKLITPFIDPVTREKLKFNEDLRQHVPPGQLMESLGGDVEFKYDHSVYWPALSKLTELRRNEYTERWIQGGKHIGEYENYLKGGNSASLSQRESPSEGSNGFIDKETA